MSIPHSVESVNVGKRTSAPEAPPRCPECRDHRVWLLSACGTYRVPQCPWCDAPKESAPACPDCGATETFWFRDPQSSPVLVCEACISGANDFDYDADTVLEPTPLEQEGVRHG